MGGCARAGMCVRAAAFPAITHTWHINCCRNSRSLKVSVLSGLEFFFFLRLKRCLPARARVAGWRGACPQIRQHVRKETGRRLKMSKAGRGLEGQGLSKLVGVHLLEIDGLAAAILISTTQPADDVTTLPPPGESSLQASRGRIWTEGTSDG